MCSAFCNAAFWKGRTQINACIARGARGRLTESLESFVFWIIRSQRKPGDACYFLACVSHSRFGWHKQSWTKLDFESFCGYMYSVASAFELTLKAPKNELLTNAELVTKGRNLIHEISITTMTSTVTSREENLTRRKVEQAPWKSRQKTMCFQDLHISLNLGGSSSKETFWASFWFWYYGSKKSLASFAYLRLSVHPPPTMKAIVNSWSRAVFDSLFFCCNAVRDRFISLRCSCNGPHARCLWAFCQVMLLYSFL